MARVKISHDDREEAMTAGSQPIITGRMRWWIPLDGSAVLQCEWSQRGGTGPSVWIDVPTITEIQE
jgi:hypothetical protein